MGLAVVPSFGLMLLCVATVIVVGAIHEFRVRRGKRPKGAQRLELEASRGDRTETPVTCVLEP